MFFNILKPTGYVLHQQFDNLHLHILSTVFIYVFYLKTNSDLCQLQNKLIGSYNLNEKCLLRVKIWVFK
jgi:hypothetical protein